MGDVFDLPKFFFLNNEKELKMLMTVIKLHRKDNVQGTRIRRSHIRPGGYVALLF